MGFNSVLITGGSGAFGTAFVKYLLQFRQDVHRISVLSRGEYRQFLMKQELGDMDSGQMRYMIGDVRDRDRLRRAFEGVEVVVHAAALKRIEVGHYNPTEMVKTNIDGAVNVVEAAKDAGVKKVVFLSSDKAYQPVSPYGLSKAMAEFIFLAANNTRGWFGPKYAVTRYGNVAGSTGSVIPIWKEMLKTSNIVPVSDPEVTRFWMYMEEAVLLVLNTIDQMVGGELSVPELPAYRLGDLAEAMGATMDIKGLPSYEKCHESMADGNSSDKARRLSVPELREMLKKV